MTGEPATLDDEYPARFDSRRSFAEEVGRRVELARFKKRWTTTDLARVAGTSQGQVSRLERGTHLPNLITMARLARALEVPLSSLVDDAIREPD
jgi:transcriptional regulator with XRE-family HTH domain